MVEIRLGDIIQTKKKHPCGEDKWLITRVGADVKIKCQGCGRLIMLERGEFEKRYRKTVFKALPADEESKEDN
jgi:hypothetical protein